MPQLGFQFHHTQDDDYRAMAQVASCLGYLSASLTRAQAVRAFHVRLSTRFANDAHPFFFAPPDEIRLHRIARGIWEARASVFGVGTRNWRCDGSCCREHPHFLSVVTLLV